jgi:hypothetical protein
MYSDKVTQSVAEAAKKVMDEELKGNQHKIDKNKNNKIDAHDFKLLRKEDSGLNLKDYSLEELEEFMVSEDYEQLDELSKTTLGSYVKKASDSAAKNSAASSNWAHTSDKARNPRVKAAAAKYSDDDHATSKKRLAGIGSAVKRLTKEEQEQIDELSANTMKSYVKGAKSDVAAHKDQKSSAMDQGDHKTASDSAAAIAKRQAGMSTAKAKLNAEEVDSLLEYESKDGVYKHQAKSGRYGGSEKESDYVKGPSDAALKKIEAEKVKKKKKFSEMVDVYKTTGIKGLFEEIQIAQEEASQEEFTKELAKQKAKAEGNAPQADVAAAAGAPVKKKSMDEEVEQVDERTLTAAEADKKEDIVKGMKKGIAGFKERYGKDAKSVMYATATARAKGE